MRLRLITSAAVVAAVLLPAPAQAAPQTETITSFAPYAITTDELSSRLCDLTVDVSWLPAVRHSVGAEVFDDTGNLRGKQVVPASVDGAHNVNVWALAATPSVLTARIYTWNDRKGTEGRLLATSAAMTLTPSSDCSTWTWTSTTPTS